MELKKNYLRGFNLTRYTLNEIHFIKNSKNEIEIKCKKAIQRYDFSDYANKGYIKGWIELKNNNKYILYIASPDVIYFPEDSSNLFWNSERTIFNLKYLEKIEFDNIDTSNVINMSSMFYGLENITKLDLSSFDTSNVTDMSDMFAECHNVKEINLESFNTQKVTSMSEMFFECEKLEKLSLKNFNTINVLDFDLTFGYMKNIKELNLENFEANSNLITTYRMFKECSKLKNLDISKFSFDNVIDTDYYTGKTGMVPKYYEMFLDVPNDIEIHVGNNEEKKNVLVIGMKKLEDKNIIIKL
jgi:surface protein